MKDFHIKTLMFIIASSCVYIISIIFFGLIRVDFFPNIFYTRASHGHLLPRIQEADSVKNIDILFLGSSHAYRGFDNRIFKNAGFTSFNLGSSAQTPEQTEILVERYIDQFSPRIVIFEVYPATFELDGLEATIDLISNMPPNTNLFNYALSTHNPVIYNSMLYAFTRNVRFPINSYKQTLETASDRYIQGGFVEKKDTSLHLAPYLKQRHRYEFRENNKLAFERIIELLEMRDIKVILVQAPLSKEMNVNISNMEEIDNYFKKFESTKVSYVTYNSPLKSEFQHKSLFFDGSHLNQKGVEVFNTDLINSYLLSDLK